MNLVARKDCYKLFCEQSPLARTKAEIVKSVEAAAEYRISVLTNVSIFEGLSIDVLSFLARNMEEIYFSIGDDIITQDDFGDSFFVLEVGTVSVSRKTNLFEPRVELKRLGPNSYFGELALINDEPRSATITVVSEGAKCLRMTKAKFDEIISVTKMFNAKRSTLSEIITEKIALFKPLSSVTRGRLLESMSNISFSPGAYICRQGTIGNAFYIITEGSCKVTLNTDHWKEKEVNKIHAGDFFGEIALLDASKKRSANVIALDRVKCMTLSKADFGILLKGVRSVMVQLRKASTLTDLAALREAADEDDENIKKEKKENSIYSIRAKVKPVSFLSSYGVKCSGRVRMLFKTMAKFMLQSLSTTLYGRMYRTMLSNPLKIQEYGQKAVKIMLDDHNNKYRGTINEIRLQCRTILEKELSFRSVAENIFISGVMDQCHALKDFLTKGWLPDQFNDLCKKLKILRVKPMDRIINVGSKGVRTYLILRGAVRILNGSIEGLEGKDVKKDENLLQQKENLMAGAYFGEVVSSGVRTHLFTATAMTHCDLVYFEDEDYLAAQDGTSKISVDEKTKFLSQISLFKNWESHRILRIANAMKEITFNSGDIILENNQNSKNIFFLCQGRIDVFQSKRSKFALFSMQNTEYFGESGFLTSIKPGRQRRLILEEYLFKANTRVEVLILPYEEFHLIDRETTDIISNYFMIKKEWRQDRCEESSREMIVNGDFQRSSKIINGTEKEKEKVKEKAEKSDVEVMIELSLSSILISSVPESISSTLSASSTSSFLSPISSSLSCSEADDLVQSLTSDTTTPLLISSSSSSSSSSLTCSSSFTIITLPSQSLSTPSSSSSSAPEGQESELLFKNSKIILPSKSSNFLNRGDIQNIDHNISQNHRYERKNLILRNEDQCLPNSNNIRYQNVDDIGYFNREPSIPNREHGRAFPTYHMNPSAIQSSRTYRPSSAYSQIKNTSKNKNKNNVPIVPLGSVSLRVKKSTWLFDLPEINVSENNAFEPLLVVGGTGTRGVTSHGVSRTKDYVTGRKILVK